MSAKEELLRFIENPVHNGAFVLNGSWGSGKTHLINELSEELNNGKDYYCIKVSLFGMSDSKLLEKTVKTQLFKGKYRIKDSTEEVVGKGINITKNLLSAIRNYNSATQVAGGLINIDLYDFIEVKNEITITGEENNRKLVLFLDDFERSSFDYKELLGIANNFIEDEGLIVCIIMDESKISNESLYFEFKEKVVERTALVDYSNATVIETIIRNSYPANKFGVYLINNLETIIAVFNDSKTYNYRILKSGLNYFNNLFSLLVSMDFKEEEITKLLVAFLAFFFEFRSNRFFRKDEHYSFYNLVMYPPSNDSQSDERIRYSSFDTIFRCSAIEDWVITGKYEEIKIMKELATIQEHNRHIPGMLELDMFQLTEDIIQEQLPQIIDDGYSGNLSQAELMKLLSLLYQFNNIGYDSPVHIDYKKLNKGLDIREENVRRNNLTEISSNLFLEQEQLDQLDDDAKALYSRLTKKDDRHEAWITRNSFIKFLSNHNSKALIGRFPLAAFDEQLLEMVKNAFEKGDNRFRYDICLELKRALITNPYITTKDDLIMSIENLNKLSVWLKRYYEQTQGNYEKSIINICNNVILELIANCNNDLENGNY